MAVMRVEKTANYTVMANYHLRDNRLSLKAKGLLSVMLSLPPEWDFTLNGLTRISREGISAIRTAIIELEETGYVTRTRIRNEAGQLIDTEYTIYESPQNVPSENIETSNESELPICESPASEKPMLENPTLDNPILDNPTLENPTLENRTQLNTKVIKKEIKNNDISNPHQSNIHPSIPETAKEITPVLPPSHNKPNTPSKQRMSLSDQSSVPGMQRSPTLDGLVKKVQDQIDYWDLIDGNDKEEIDNILSIMVEVLSTKCEYFTISGRKFPADLVHQRYTQITYSTVLYVLECMHKCGSDIRNIKQYLITTLFNAPATCDSYYGAAVRRDFQFMRG